MARAVAAVNIVGEDYAVGFDPHGVADLGGGFFGKVNLHYRSGGAYFRAFGAFRAAISAFIT